MHFFSILSIDISNGCSYNDIIERTDVRICIRPKGRQERGYEKDDDESEGTDFDLAELDEYKNLSLLDKMVVYTDYSPRKEGTKRYRGSNLPETTLTLYPYPDGSRRPVYRDRRYILPGFAYPAEFYSPDYSKQTPPEPTDYRRTLYWNPNLQLDENGQARITFYNNSRTTQISVEAEGQASNGTLLWSK